MNTNAYSVPDLALTLDIAGMIVAVRAAETTPQHELDVLVGQPWKETVDRVSATKVARLLADTRVRGFGGFIEINQLMPDGSSHLMEFSAIRTDAASPLMAVVGKSLSTVVAMQQRLSEATHSMEREFWRLRDIETRYLSVLNLLDNPVVVVERHTLRVVEANGKALHTHGLLPAPVSGPDTGQDANNNANPHPGRTPGSFLELSEADAVKLEHALSENEAAETTPSMVLRIGSAGDRWIVRATRLKSHAEDCWILRLESLTPPVDIQRLPTETLEQFIRKIPAPLAITDIVGRITWFNPEFTSWANSRAAEEGKPAPTELMNTDIERWTGSANARITSAVIGTGQDQQHLIMIC